MKLSLIKQDDGKTGIFKNFERADERLLFEQTIEILKSTPQAKLTEEIMGPSEDISVWEIDKEKVFVIFDLDYGAEIKAETKKAFDNIHSIIELYNQNSII